MTDQFVRVRPQGRRHVRHHEPEGRQRRRQQQHRRQAVQERTELPDRHQAPGDLQQVRDVRDRRHGDPPQHPLDGGGCLEMLRL